MATFPRGIPPDERVVRPRSERASASSPSTGARPPAPQYASKLPGDPVALRGIPAIGRGVGGAIRGTNPATASVCRPVHDATIDLRAQPESARL